MTVWSSEPEEFSTPTRERGSIDVYKRQLIVPQKIAEQNKPLMSIMNAMIAGDKAIVNEAVHRDELRMNVGGFLFNSQDDLFIEFLSNQLMLSYLGI